MPREYEMIVEIPKSKCPDCGSRNKLYTVFLDSFNRYVGYELKCCMCGHITEHFNNNLYNGTGKRPKLKIVKEQCLRSSFCPHKDCRLYLDKTIPPEDCGDKKCDPDCDCCCNKKINSDKLTIKLERKPKFL